MKVGLDLETNPVRQLLLESSRSIIAHEEERQQRPGRPRGNGGRVERDDDGDDNDSDDNDGDDDDSDDGRRGNRRGQEGGNNGMDGRQRAAAVILPHHFSYLYEVERQATDKQSCDATKLKAVSISFPRLNSNSHTVLSEPRPSEKVTTVRKRPADTVLAPPGKKPKYVMDLTRSDMIEVISFSDSDSDCVLVAQSPIKRRVK